MANYTEFCLQPSLSVPKSRKITLKSKGLISVLVCELCWFCRVMARKKGERGGLGDRPRHGYSIPSVLEFGGGTVREEWKSVL
ncbi:hypothetical protein KY290_033555 [Solanum tuberosum]|uniref:Uncharacterized protein n=1 Tax=Solanum tuberosum TaxID=4113 RepID=A0ABQ7U0M8_SOLTU|nr:hypothetical protein KY289_032920 [Solanum tuberosum]KAH0647566.1 hypothetical protein KY285_032814 [Solanum tuberosum]KAH0740512.1 hypothetical protein KY290_033555 [Solanum tuberosum]